MKIDAVLILAAGKGARMGEIGKVIPKVIWPIFNKSILELEVCYAKTFSPDKIFINTYNHKDKIKKYIKDHKGFVGVTIVEETDEIDIGGAVHNVAKYLSYKGNLLVINSDQFIMLSKKKKNDFFNSYKKFGISLLVYEVSPNSGYSCLRIENEIVRGIISKEESFNLERPVTYTGMSLLNLETLAQSHGKSAFFQSVANFKERSVGCVNIDDSSYWDFGTINRYIESMISLKKANDSFTKFLKLSGVDFKEQSKCIVTENAIIFKDSL